jgi:Asp-tRNA(Asn)/Glu-tRNA(Gln) amidotransferase A subunit family amidase
VCRREKIGGVGGRRDDGMPLWVQLVASPGREDLLCAVARELGEEFGGVGGLD